MIFIPYRFKYQKYPYSPLATFVSLLVNNVLYTMIMTFIMSGVLFGTIAGLFGFRISSAPDWITGAYCISCLAIPVACKVLGRKYNWAGRTNVSRIKKRLQKNEAFARKFHAENPGSLAFIREIRPDFAP